MAATTANATTTAAAATTGEGGATDDVVAPAAADDGDDDDAAATLPSLLVVKVAFPGDDVDDFAAFFAHYARGVTVSSSGPQGAGADCAYATARAGGNLDVRLVSNPRARAAPGRTVADWAQYAQSVHEHWTGEQGGAGRARSPALSAVVAHDVCVCCQARGVALFRHVAAVSRE